MASRITDQSSVCSILCLDWQQRNIKGPCYCPFMRGIHWWPQTDNNMENVSIWWRHNEIVQAQEINAHIISIGPHEKKRSWARFNTVIIQLEDSQPVLIISFHLLKIQYFFLILTRSLIRSPSSNQMHYNEHHNVSNQRKIECFFSSLSRLTTMLLSTLQMSIV